jgi:GT2 family glycosyltransferase/glycosyltransferase involved in cell wall biosynthesis
VIEASIVIPVLDKLEFTRQCLDRIWRNTGSVPCEVIVVDNGSRDGTAEFFADTGHLAGPVRYHRNERNLGYAKGNNVGATLASGRHLVFLNNDTLVQPGWLAEMLRVIKSDPRVGIVGIKQLFPYTNVLYHTGIVFGPDGLPQHLYPHLDASLPQVNIEREYQAVTGACLLIERALFDECGGFDETYVNGYEDIDLCLRARERKRTVVCCTSAYIYHYGQISEGRTADDDQNARLFAQRWKGRLRADRDEYLIKDRFITTAESASAAPAAKTLSDDCIYLADDLGQASALTWVNVELATALAEIGVPVFVNGDRISTSVPSERRKQLARLSRQRPIGGAQIKWSHYWPQHLQLELCGDINLELFVINYVFGRPGSEAWDYWMQCVRGNGLEKLPASDFCRSVLEQIGVPKESMHVLPYGYAREIHEVEPRRRRGSRFRFLTVTNSHDLNRYGTGALLDAWAEAFDRKADVELVVKDYGASSGDRSLRDWLKRRQGAPVTLVDDFTTKTELIRLYKSCDAFVSAHRGEGFGMKILDAMACGLPVIAPLFGGPTEFCSNETCYPVDFSLLPVRDCIDSRSLQLTNDPRWAEPDRRHLAGQLRAVFERQGDAAIVAARGRSAVIERFSWNQIARNLVAIVNDVPQRRPRLARTRAAASPSKAERSPYWLGVRVSVVIPTYNRKDKLMACLDALERQSVLPDEFEVVIVDDGTTDGTKEAVASKPRSFAVRYFEQRNQGPGSARNRGIDEATGEIVLFVGDDVYADERLLEEHLLAHAIRPAAGTAILGHLDWPADMPRNAVMNYVCGDAALQFAYTLIPRLPVLDHRFFYTSNISLKREFLASAATAGIRFDPAFRHAAFEDSEFAFRLLPRGLEIRYVESARAVHDHPMDLEGFAARERRAGEMAVVFYRKHPGQDDQLQVQWLSDLSAAVGAQSIPGEILARVDSLDRVTDRLLREFARSLERGLRHGVAHHASASMERRGRVALNNVLRAIFDVERTRGKVLEWFSGVDEASKISGAQLVATTRLKQAFLEADVTVTPLPVDLAFAAAPATGTSPARGQLVRRTLRRIVAHPRVFPHLLTADRLVQNTLQAPGREAWLERYRSLRKRLR